MKSLLLFGGYMVRLRIALTAVLVALITSCGGGNSSSTPTSPTISAATVTIQANARTLSTFAFVPNPVTLSSGGVAICPDSCRKSKMA